MSKSTRRLSAIISDALSRLHVTEGTSGVAASKAPAPTSAPSSPRGASRAAPKYPSVSTPRSSSTPRVTAAAESDSDADIDVSALMSPEGAKSKKPSPRAQSALRSPPLFVTEFLSQSTPASPDKRRTGVMANRGGEPATEGLTVAIPANGASRRAVAAAQTPVIAQRPGAPLTVTTTGGVSTPTASSARGSGKGTLSSRPRQVVGTPSGNSAGGKLLSPPVLGAIPASRRRSVEDVQQQLAGTLADAGPAEAQAAGNPIRLPQHMVSVLCYPVTLYRTMYRVLTRRACPACCGSNQTNPFHLSQALLRVNNAAASPLSVASSPANSIAGELYTGETPSGYRDIDALGRQAPLEELGAFDAAIDGSATTPEAAAHAARTRYDVSDSEAEPVLVAVGGGGHADAPASPTADVLSPPSVVRGDDKIAPSIRRSVAELATSLNPDVLRRRVSVVTDQASHHTASVAVDAGTQPREVVATRRTSILVSDSFR